MILLAMAQTLALAHDLLHKFGGNIRLLRKGVPLHGKLPCLKSNSEGVSSCPEFMK